ncbi:MAG: hypothetical protein Q4F66_09475 [Clostridium sp.]|nr:hypothetical protein [Clostridium sp.]
MITLKKLNSINGFDRNDLVNAKQNNYAWSMAEFGDYIYVGTGRNIAWLTTNLLASQFKSPLLISTNTMDNTAEIWRYKKDDTEKWERVYKAKKEDNIAGFRYMTVHAPENGAPAIYAAPFTIGKDSNDISILKSTDGSNWTKVGGNLEGGSSRSMISFNGVLYVSTLDSDSALGGEKSLLYASKDPEFFDFKSVINYDDRNYIEGKNPVGGIDNMEVFNNKLYISVNSEDGLEVWRSNSDTPKLNDWTLVIDKGFGEGLNKNSMAMGVFKDHLYISTVKGFPLVLLVPLGSEMVRIDKNDKWELVVGGEPIVKTEPITGTRGKSISGLTGGFSNPFNVYIWQIKEFRGNLLATTFDHGSNIEVLRDIALLNKESLVSEVGETIYNLIIKLYNKTLEIFNRVNYQRGFDMYSSRNGIRFFTVTLDGLNNGNNYGGRILMTDSKGNIYIGTANPYDGCEVYRNNLNDKRAIIGTSLIKSIDMSKIMNEIEDIYEEIMNFADFK